MVVVVVVVGKMNVVVVFCLRAPKPANKDGMVSEVLLLFDVFDLQQNGT